MTQEDRNRIQAWEARTGGFINLPAQGGGASGAAF